MAFRCEASPLAEMQRMEALHQRDPQSASNMVANGKLLVEWARDGRLRELQCALEHLGETRVLLFYAVRMFRVACLTRRLDVLRFMLANGFDLQQACMRDVLHGVVEAIDSDASADDAQPLVRFLLDAGVDVNWQREGDLRTALHVACGKNLYGIAYLLVLYDADVNAIAADDEMPLLSAERMAMLGRCPAPTDVDQNRLLLALLNECGARRSWRRPRASTSDKHDDDDEPTAGVAPAASGGHSARPLILSLSSATTHCAHSAPVSRGALEELSEAFAEGIQLETRAADG